jgi:hypothetical protein
MLPLLASMLVYLQTSPALTDSPADAAELRQAFVQAEGKVRMVLLLSPT